MATSTLQITGAWWGTGGSARWTEADFIQSGQSNGANYRSKIAISTAGLTIVRSSKLVVKIQHYSISSPFGVEGILTEDNTIPANDCQNQYAGAASDTLKKAAIASSYAYSDEAGEVPVTAETGISVAAGGEFYLVFDVADLQQDKTYYLYFIRNLRDGYSGSGWFEAKTAAVVPTLTYVNYTAITAPGNLSAGSDLFETEVTLTWEAAQAGDNNPVALYQIHCQDSDDAEHWGEWKHIADVAVDQCTFSEAPGISRGSYRRYHIRAVGSTGMAEFESPYVSIDVRRNRLPAAPVMKYEGAVLINSGQEVEITWEAAQDPDGDACSYVVSRTVDGDWIEVNVGTELSFREVRQAEAGAVTQYRVCAYDSLGAQSEWTIGNEITFNSPPTAPTTAQISESEYSPGDFVKLSWDGATDEDGNISGYIVGYRLSEGEEWEQLQSVDSSDAFGSVTLCPDQAQYHQRIFYAVKTVDTLGAESPWLEIGSVLRNDVPHAHIFKNSIPGNYVPVMKEARFMPHIRVNGEWVRHSGQR